MLMIAAAGAGKLYADRTAPDTEKTGE